MSPFNESIVENTALSSFVELGYTCTNGLLIAPGEPAAERGEKVGDLRAFDETPELAGIAGRNAARGLASAVVSI